MTTSPIRIATRASALALWQANYVAGRLRQAAPGRDVELVEITTSGDRNQTDPLSQFGGVGVFTREVQKAVLDGRADVAVHSLKDLPTDAVAGLVLAAVPERASTHDALVLPQAADNASQRSAVRSGVELLKSLSPGARIGTGSLRRRAQLLHLRSDLQTSEVRGNVETRLRKLDEGQYDALVLAEAGLRRLGLDARISGLLMPPQMLPAVGQGALGIECRTEDAQTRAALAAISDPATFPVVLAERALLAELRAGCHAPLGVSAALTGGQLRMEAVVLSADGTVRLLAHAHGSGNDPVALGRAAADDLRRQGADAIIRPSS